VAAFLFVVAILGVLVWATLRESDAWPLSRYPMFSRRADPERVRVCRVALETNGGEAIWWRSRFRRYPERVGRALLQIDAGRDGSARADAVADLATAKVLLEVQRLIRLEEGGLGRYRAIRVERRSTVREAGGWSVHDETAARVPLAPARGSRG